MKKITLIAFTVIGTATFLNAQEKKQTNSTTTNDASFKAVGRLVTSEEAKDFKLAENTTQTTPERATFIGKATLVEKETPTTQKTTELNAAPVRTAPRAQESKPIAR